MLRITAKINIGDGGGDLQNVTSTIAGINGSSTIGEVIGHHTQIQKPFIFGRSRLGGGQCYTKKANFFIGSISSDMFGNFQSNYIIDISGSNITQLTIVFNKQKGEYPKSIKVDGEDFADDDPQWTIPLTSANTHKIIISNWNKPYSPMVISSIYTDLSIDIDDTNLLDFDSTIMSRDNYITPSFGIISNSGSLSFIDKDGEVADLIAQRIVNSNNVISLYLENTANGAREQVAYMNTQKWDYSTQQSIADITIKDDLEELQEIQIPAINYTPTISTSQNAQWLYEHLYAQTPAKFKMLSYQELDLDTKMILVDTVIEYPMLEADNLWAQWNKLCQLCRLNIYKNNKGRTICKYSGGKYEP